MGRLLKSPPSIDHAALGRLLKSSLAIDYAALTKELPPPGTTATDETRASDTTTTAATGETLT